MSESIIRLRPVRQWDAPKDPLKDWEKYGFYPEIEEPTWGSKPQTAILRASLDRPSPLHMNYKTDEEGRTYVDIAGDIVVPIFTGMHTEEMRSGDRATYLLIVHDVGEFWPSPSSPALFYTSWSKVNVELRRDEGRVYHGQKVARISVVRVHPNGCFMCPVVGDEFIEFMTPKISYKKDD